MEHDRGLVLKNSHQLLSGWKKAPFKWRYNVSD
jgi:hypothetical protein